MTLTLASLSFGIILFLKFFHFLNLLKILCLVLVFLNYSEGRHCLGKALQIKSVHVQFSGSDPVLIANVSTQTSVEQDGDFHIT